MAVVAGLIDDLGRAAAFRTGNESWNDQAEFLNLNVVIFGDCQDSPNLIFVPVRVPVAIATGVALAQNQAGPYVFHLHGRRSVRPGLRVDAGGGGDRERRDARMTAHIQSEAARRASRSTASTRARSDKPFSPVRRRRR